MWDVILLLFHQIIQRIIVRVPLLFSRFRPIGSVFSSSTLRSFDFGVRRLCLIATTVVFGGLHANGAWAALPAGFPPRDVKVMRSWVTSQTLRLRFEPASLSVENLVPGKAVTYLLAGSSQMLPRVRFVDGHFYRARGSEIVGEVYGAPPGLDLPGALVRINKLGLFREYPVYSFTVSFATNAKPLYPLGTESWFADYVEFEVDLGPPPAGRTSTVEADASHDHSSLSRFEHALLLNPDISSAYLETTSPQTGSDVFAWAELMRPAAECASLFQVRVYKPGFYRITRADLEVARSEHFTSAPLPPLAPPNTWRVFSKGEEIAPIEAPQSESDELFVLVPLWDVDEEGPAVLWIDASGPQSDGVRSTRLLPKPATPAAPTDPLTLAECEAVCERLEDYQARIRPTAEVTRWYWKSIPPQGIEVFPLELPSTFSPNEEVEVSVFSALAHSRQKLPFLEFIVCGDTIATAPLTGVQGVSRLTVPATILRPGRNEIGLKLCYTDDSSEEQRELLVQKMTVRWRQLLDRLPCTSFQLKSERTKTPHHLVCEFNDTTGPVFLGALAPQSRWAALVSGGKKASIPDAPFGQTLVAVPVNEIPRPSEVVAVTTSVLALLRPNVGADYLVIAHPSLLRAATPLVTRRQEQGHSTLLVNVEDVFSLFGFGARNSNAIRKFLTYVYYCWPSPRLRHVLLVGEASEYRRDPKEASPKCQLDMVPTCGFTRTESLHGDHPYACVAGTDPVPDLFVGRLSVATPDELTSAIAKLSRYESESVGKWASSALFVTDDNEEFPRIASDVIAAASAPPLVVRKFNEADYLYVPNPRVYGKRRSWDATRELIDWLNSGLSFVNYFGHGGPNLWSHERLFHILDIPKLTEPSRLPLIACASCDNAWLDYPMPPVKASMGELLVKKPEGGAVAVFAPVSGATPYEHQNLMTFLLEAMTRTPLRSVGEVANYAKIYYYAQTLSPAVPEQYVVVGDPALELKIPRLGGELSVEPQSLQSGRVNSISVRGENLPATLTSATLSVISIATNDEILSRPVAVVQGQASAIVTVPELQPAPYAILLSYPQGNEEKTLVGRFDVVLPRLALDEEKLVGLGTTLIGTTEPVKTCVSLMNASPLGPLSAQIEALFTHHHPHSSFPIIRDVATIPGRAAFQYLFDWTPRLPRRLHVQWSALNPPLPWRTFSLELPRSDNQTSESFVVPYGVKVVAPQELTEFDTPTFACEIWNVGIDASQESMVSLFLGDDALAQSQLLPKLSPGTKRQMTFVSRRSLPAGLTTVTLLIQRRDSTSTSPERWETLYEREDPVFVERAPELEIVPGSVVADVPSEGIIARTSIRIRARLRNNGEVAARNVRYQLKINNPTTGTEAMMLNEERAAIIPEIAPGEEIPIEARWENCNDAGTPSVWLVVNGSKTIKENDYSNNVALVPPFKVRQLGDFRALSLDYAPKNCTDGTTIIVEGTVLSDADLPRGPLDVEIGLRNPLTHQSESQRIIINSIPPNTTQTLSTVFAYRSDFTEAYIVVNASKELEERDSGGNELVTPLQPTIIIEKRQSEALTKLINLSDDLSRTVSYNLEFLPGPALRLTDTPTSSSGMNPVDPSWARAGNYITKPRGSEDDSDNQWIVAPWLIEATGSEHCGPLSLRIPISPWIADIPYDLYLHAVSSANYKGSPLRRFMVAVDGGATTTIDLRIENSARPIQRSYVGRFKPAQPWFDVTVTQTTGSGVVIKGAEIVPAAGFADSPLYVFRGDASKPRKVSFVDNDTAAAAIRYWLRTALPSQNELEWSEWRPIVGKATTLDSHALGFQWRAVFYPQQKLLRPTLKEVLLLEGE